MERTNVTDKGYTYGNQNFVNETRTDSQGNKYTVALPSTISAASLGTAQSTPPLAQPTYNTSGQQAQTAQAQGYTQSSFDSTQALADQEAETARQYAGSNAKGLADLQASLGLKGQDIATQYNQQDETGTSVNSLAGKLRSLNAKSQALGQDTLAKQQEEINKATGQNITQSAVSRNTADATRENLINQARIAMESAVVKADYDTAKSYADQMIDAKYDGILAEIEAKKTNIQAYKDLVLTPAEKKQADITTRRLDAEQKQAEQKMANEKDISNMIIEATPNAPTSVIANAKKLAESGASKLAVAQALGVYGGDYLKTQLLKAQIDTEKAQKRKYDADIDKIKADMNTKGLTPTTANIAKVEASQSVYDIAQELLTAEGKGGAVGFGIKKSLIGSLPFVEGTAIAGTDRATYESKFKQLKDTLASANLDKLKGAMSDKDIEFLRNIGTALSLDMPETAFDAELKKVQNTMTKVPGVQVPKVPQAPNKFNQALGMPSESLQGTAIVNSVDDNGNINFNLPK